ncbi:MAG TPA: asparagine synthase (glutamine-hydrolyzing) [Chloroflexota bacterium]|nr:asparagine synthase (glutamine-hydrolyzing) [Chloroflexota bacterium]
MCGICGAFYFGRSEPVTSELIEAMSNTITHRGPDDAGLYLSSDRSAGLGFRRLSIVDLAGGHQPMANETDDAWIVFNGEIYNHADHRLDLERRGHTYRTRSDTETIVHLYEEHGAGCVDFLRGMFAFAIWDERQRRLFLARDRIGVKPLYYTVRDGAFLFASEIKALLAHPLVSRELDRQALHHYLTFAATPAPFTLFKGIHKLPPAHTMMVSSSGEISTQRYWDAASFAEEDPPRPEWEYVERLREKLRESVKLRMMSDVPFGVFLSGGLDSSLNVALMSELMDRPVDTFSVSIEGDSVSDELQWARRVAKEFGANHHEVSINDQTFVDFFPTMVHHQDEPLADPVCVPIHFVSKLARDNGTIVVQVGEGSDELFCGYTGWQRYLSFYNRAWKPFVRMPGLLREATATFVGPALTPTRRDFLDRAAHDRELFWSGAVAFWETEKRALLGGWQNGNGHVDSFDIVRTQLERLERVSPGQDQLHRMTFLELNQRLPELLLMRVDKMSMAQSIEARVPFLDHKVVELGLTIPSELKYRHSETKYILKRAAEGILPREIIYREKAGFCGSSRNMLSPRLLSFSGEVIPSSAMIRTYFNPSAVDTLLSDQREGRADNSFKVWNLLNLALWHQHWFE